MSSEIKFRNLVNMIYLVGLRFGLNFVYSGDFSSHCSVTLPEWKVCELTSLSSGGFDFDGAALHRFFFSLSLEPSDQILAACVTKTSLQLMPTGDYFAAAATLISPESLSD